MNEKLDTMYELCEILMRELEEVAEKISKAGSMSAGYLETVDKLSHAMKSIKTTIAMMEADDEGGYSKRSMAYAGGASNARAGMSNRSGRSYARGRVNNPMGRNQYSRENSRESGYSYADSMDEMLDEMRGMIGQLPEEKRRKAMRLIDELSE